MEGLVLQRNVLSSPSPSPSLSPSLVVSARGGDARIAGPRFSEECPRSRLFSSSFSRSSWLLCALGRRLHCPASHLSSVRMHSSTAAAPPIACPLPSQEVLKIWQNADAVCFDVDSTVCTDEGIDALGEFCGAGAAVAAWTSRAMGGSVPFEEALAARLSLFKPSLKNLEDYLARNPPKITPGIEELFKELQSRGKDIYLISGGFREIIAPVAKRLQIPENRIFANKLLFDGGGRYAGFDATEPTSRSGGKAAAIAQIKQNFGYKRLVMIGDGATDLEARKPGGADIFICFGGVQFRASVAAQSDWCVLDFNDLVEALDQTK